MEIEWSECVTFECNFEYLKKVQSEISINPMNFILVWCKIIISSTPVPFVFAFILQKTELKFLFSVETLTVPLLQYSPERTVTKTFNNPPQQNPLSEAQMTCQSNHTEPEHTFRTSHLSVNEKEQLLSVLKRRSPWKSRNYSESFK